MAESSSAPGGGAVMERAGEAFTCERCEVTASWMVDSEYSGLPAGWIEEGGLVHCLACRRDLAGEAGLAAAPKDTPASELPKLKASARVEFEIERDPERVDGQIAKACGTSIAAVRKARERLGKS